MVRRKSSTTPEYAPLWGPRRRVLAGAPDIPALCAHLTAFPAPLRHPRRLGASPVYEYVTENACVIGTAGHLASPGVKQTFAGSKYIL